MKKVINGKEYELVDRVSYKGRACIECSANDDIDICNALPDHCIVYSDKVWKEVEDET